MIFHLDLTAYEQEELNQLSDELFNNELHHFSKNVMFKVFTEEEKQTDKFKRYNYLLDLKLKHLKQIKES